MNPHCLIVSPIPSHPQFQGNSARIFRFGRCLQALGYRVHFLYYPLEGLTPRQREQMSADWDYFYSLPCQLPSGGKMSGRGHYRLDDWYDPRVGDLAATLHRRWNYRFVLTNYVWFSGVLDALPASLFKIIDTHDVFGDRHLRSIEAGMPPEWFYTTVAEEQRGLERADLVLAIQDEERAYYRALGLPRVETVGFITPRRQAARLPRERVAVGYLASSNPWNVNGFEKLVAALARYPGLERQADFWLAGPICGKVDPAKLGPFKPLGVLDQVDDFYARADIALNPMLGGTGLKIKTVEALSFGCGVLSTVDGFVGIPSPYPEHRLAGMDALADALAERLAAPEPGFAETLRRNSKQVFSSYQARQSLAFNDLFQVLRAAA